MDPFAAIEHDWTRVSSRLVTARRATLLLGCAVVTLAVFAAAVLTRIPRPFVVTAALTLLVFGSWAWWLIGRRVRSWGYALRDDDLIVTSGILFRRLVIVPYGRMQLVDVVAGPIERAFRISTVQLHTAAASTDATIPGLEPDQAAGLRDTLARLGEARTAGL